MTSPQLPNPVPSTPTPHPVPAVDLDVRMRSVQIALAFLLGAMTALLSVRLAGGRFTRPADLNPNSISAYRVDLNHASQGELRQLPGVGPALADRIVASRPFESADDLRQVVGFGPSTLRRVQPYVAFNGTGMTRAAKAPATALDPNAATLIELQQLPGVGPKLAQRIVDERSKKLFATVEDLRRVPGIGVKTLEKLRPYLTFAARPPVG